MMFFDPPRLNRRAALATAAAVGLGAFVPRIGRAEASSWQSAIVNYLESLARSDGGYAWNDEGDSHLTATFAAIGCYRLLHRTPPRKPQLAEFVRTQPPSRQKKLDQERRLFAYQQAQALAWLGEKATELQSQVRQWTKPRVYLKQYEPHGYPLFPSEVSVFACRELLGMRLDELSPHFTGYLDSRRRANGSFNSTPAADGSDGHVLNTWCGTRRASRAEAC